MQGLLFEYNELKAPPQTIKDDYDFEADNTEAVVYLTGKDGWIADMYVMKKKEAVLFCDRPETAKPYGARAWIFMFTTHKRDWYENRLYTFREDDGRFDWLLALLGIDPIYRKKK